MTEDYSNRVLLISPNNLPDLIDYIVHEEHSSIAEYCARMPKGFVDPRLIAGGKEKFALLAPKIQYDQMKEFVDRVHSTLESHAKEAAWSVADREYLESNLKSIHDWYVPDWIANGVRAPFQPDGGPGDEEYDEWLKESIAAITIERVAATSVEFAIERFERIGLMIPGYDIDHISDGCITALMFHGQAAYEPCGGSCSGQQYMAMLSELFDYECEYS